MTFDWKITKQNKTTLQLTVTLNLRPNVIDN